MVDARRVLTDLQAMPPGQIVEPGVTAADALAVMTPGEVPDDVRYIPGQVYGTAGRPLTMELFARADPTESRPGVVFIHGGGFVEGFPEMLIRYAAQLASRGFVTASIDYRLAGEAPYPASIEDSKCAVRWFRAHAAEIGLDPSWVAVAGNSAGGYLSGMVGSTPGQLEGTGGWADQSSAVQSVVMWYPAVDLRPSATTPVATEAVEEYFGRIPDEAQAFEASPAAHIRQAPPTLTLSGTDDPIVPIQQLREYHRRLNELGIANRLVEFPGVGHSFDYSLQRWGECFSELVAWVNLLAK